MIPLTTDSVCSMSLTMTYKPILPHLPYIAVYIPITNPVVIVPNRSHYYNQANIMSLLIFGYFSFLIESF